MGNKVVGLDGDTLHVEHNMYNLTPGITALITYKRPQGKKYTDDDYTVYRALVAQTEIVKFPITQLALDQYSSWKWNHMLMKMFTPMES